MLKLYGDARNGIPRSRGTIIQWYLEELGIPYEYVMLNVQAGEHRQPEFLGINPMGKVPAIVDGDFKLCESGAILLYLAEKYGGDSTTEERAQWAQWTLFANSTLVMGVFVEANREREMPRLMGALNDILDKRSFLLGNKFTVADVAVGVYIKYILMKLQLDLSPYSELMNYMKRLAERPAFQKVQV